MERAPKWWRIWRFLVWYVREIFDRIAYLTTLIEDSIETFCFVFYCWNDWPLFPRFSVELYERSLFELSPLILIRHLRRISIMSKVLLIHDSVKIYGITTDVKHEFELCFLIGAHSFWGFGQRKAQKVPVAWLFVYMTQISISL